MESASMSGTSGCKRKRTAGRQKIAIEPIQTEASRQVCFSKRRNGLFKKAKELADKCGADIKVIVFSPAGKPFSFIHSSSDCCPVSDQDLNIHLADLDFSINAAKEKKSLLKASFGGDDVADLKPDEMDAALKKRQRLSADLALRINELSFTPNQFVPVQETVPVQYRYVKDDLSFLPYQLVPAALQKPAHIQAENGYDGSFDGFSQADLFHLDDFCYRG